MGSSFVIFLECCVDISIVFNCISSFNPCNSLAGTLVTAVELLPLLLPLRAELRAALGEGCCSTSFSGTTLQGKLLVILAALALSVSIVFAVMQHFFPVAY